MTTKVCVLADQELAIGIAQKVVQVGDEPLRVLQVAWPMHAVVGAGVGFNRSGLNRESLLKVRLGPHSAGRVLIKPSPHWVEQCPLRI